MLPTSISFPFDLARSQSFVCCLVVEALAHSLIHTASPEPFTCDIP